MPAINAEGLKSAVQIFVAEEDHALRVDIADCAAVLNEAQHCVDDQQSASHGEAAYFPSPADKARISLPIDAQLALSGRKRMAWRWIG
jgi:hypothetical protein